MCFKSSQCGVCSQAPGPDCQGCRRQTSSSSLLAWLSNSTEVGKLILQASTGNLKRVSLELGGKSPNVIFADADLEKAVASSALGFAMLSGQICWASTRVFVQRHFHDRFVDQLARYVSTIKTGDPLDASTTVGPLVSRAQLNRVKGYFDVGKQEGAKPVLGGETRSGKGFYIDPTIFTEVRNTMRIAREEIFGPVASCGSSECDCVLKNEHREKTA